jgi:hypothetical protein
MADLNLEKRLAGLSAEARLRVESVLKEALGKEGELSAKFDRSGFDRGPFDRSSDIALGEDVFAEKGAAAKGPAR